MDRRTFLAAAAATVGTAATSRVSLASPGRSPRTLRKAVMLGMIAEGDTIMDKFQIARDCGLQGLEVDSPSKLSADELLAAQEKTGVKIHGLVNSVHWSVPLNNPDPVARAKCVEAIRTNIKESVLFGATSILLVPAVVRDGMPYDDAYRITQEEIRKVLPEAEKAGVKISIENVWNNFLLSPLEAARYVDELASPAAAWHFDIGNVINTGYPDQWIRVLGARIHRLHIKDFSRKKRDAEGLWKGFNVELGEGDAGWPKVMAALDVIGYSTDPAGRWATAEVGGGDRKRIAQVSEQMDKLFAM
jgi:hexulose-6-phosphate isomerase